MIPHLNHNLYKWLEKISSMALLDPLFDPLFGPFLNWSPAFGIIVIALAYKYLTDQDKMKHLKGRQKEFQTEMNRTEITMKN